MNKVWGALVGARYDLHLGRKTWHKLAVIGAFATSLFVYAIAATRAQSDRIEPNERTTFALSLLSFAKGRPGVTTFGDMEALSTSGQGLSSIGLLASDGRVQPLDPAPEPPDFSCATPPPYHAQERVKLPDPKDHKVVREYQAIADTPDQPAAELRHCAATAKYANLVADRIVTYQLNSSVRRVRAARGLLRGAIAIPIWLFVYWNIYYRTLVPIYARRHEKRVRRRTSRSTL
jgi:hypothetical protein